MRIMFLIMLFLCIVCVIHLFYVSFVPIVFDLIHFVLLEPLQLSLSFISTLVFLSYFAKCSLSSYYSHFIFTARPGRWRKTLGLQWFPMFLRFPPPRVASVSYLLFYLFPFLHSFSFWFSGRSPGWDSVGVFISVISASKSSFTSATWGKLRYVCELGLGVCSKYKLGDFISFFINPF